MSGEEWRPVVGHEGPYEVSDQGRVRSVPRKITNRNGVTQTRRGVTLKPTLNAKGYPLVDLCSGRRMRSVHSLVIEAFGGPRPEGMEIRHLDGNPANSALANLRYGTQSENMQDAVRHGTQNMVRKTRCPAGHEYTAENTYVTPRRPNARYCRACHLAHSRAHKERLRRAS